MMKHAIYRKSDIEMDASCAYLIPPLFIKWINLLHHISVYGLTAKISDFATITSDYGDGLMD